MERNYPTGIKFRIFQAAVLSLSLLLASVSVAGCLLGDLAAEFPDAPQYLLQSFVTFPTIGGMIANVVGGASAAKVGKKNLCLIGIALWARFPRCSFLPWSERSRSVSWQAWALA